MISYDDFAKLDIRVGEIVEAAPFIEARNPAYKLWVDFGAEIGVKQSSAQITECYDVAALVGKQILGVVNFPVKRIAGFASEVLILGVYNQKGVILIQPDQRADKGDKVG